MRLTRTLRMRTSLTYPQQQHWKAPMTTTLLQHNLSTCRLVAVCLRSRAKVYAVCAERRFACLHVYACVPVRCLPVCTWLHVSGFNAAETAGDACSNDLYADMPPASPCRPEGQVDLTGRLYVLYVRAVATLHILENTEIESLVDKHRLVAPQALHALRAPVALHILAHAGVSALHIARSRPT